MQPFLIYSRSRVDSSFFYFGRLTDLYASPLSANQAFNNQSLTCRFRNSLRLFFFFVFFFLLLRTFGRLTSFEIRPVDPGICIIIHHPEETPPYLLYVFHEIIELGRRSTRRFQQICDEIRPSLSRGVSTTWPYVALPYQ